MPIPQLTPFPDPPRIYQPEEEFDAKADEMAGHLPVMVNEINAMVAGSNAAWADINTKTTAATNAASTASNAATAAATAASNAELFKQAAASSANSAGNSASAALSFKNAAEVSATAAAASVNPVGTIIFYAKSTVPTGYLKANGAAVSRTTYAALFAVLGTVFGAGDGSTTFNLPDLRGEFVRGWDDARGVDSGRSFGSSQDSTEVPYNNTSPSGYSGSRSLCDYIQPLNSDGITSQGGLSTWGLLTIGSGSALDAIVQRTKVRPRNMALLACIKF